MIQGEIEQSFKEVKNDLGPAAGASRHDSSTISFLTTDCRNADTAKRNAQATRESG